MRLLLALALHHDSIDKISALRRPLAGVAWHFPHNYLVSLSYLGKIESRTLLREIDHALCALRIAPFELLCAGLGFTTVADGGQIWVDVRLTSELKALKGKVDYALRRIGVDISKRRFRPRVTIGHFRGAPSVETLNWASAHNLFRCDAGSVKQLTLVSCDRLDGTPYYDPCATYDLAPKPMPTSAPPSCDRPHYEGCNTMETPSER